MTAEAFATEGVEQVDERRHILVGDLEWLEFAVADYVAKWCTLRDSSGASMTKHVLVADAVRLGEQLVALADKEET